MDKISEVIFTEIKHPNGNVGLITLNRPKVLNALNHAMINAINEQLIQWEESRDIKAIIIQATEGRAFCAGGDIRYIYEQVKHHKQITTGFFRDEYQLNSQISHYSKPYISLLNGITMGGGVGISIHGSHRIATENLIFSMPETTIGFFPDIGATYFLPRLPYNIGIYLGLTAVRITTEDCMALGLTNYFVSAEKLSELIQAIVAMEINVNAKSSVSKVIARYAKVPNNSLLLEQKNNIENIFNKTTVEEIICTLEKNPSEWHQQTAALLKTKSPTSLKVTLQALKLGEKMDLDACLQMEYRLVNRFLQGHDFHEGVRALIVDKDQSPQWSPARLEEVTQQVIDNYFTELIVPD